MGAEYEYGKVKLSDIDIKTSHQNQARVESALLPEKVEEYRLDMDRELQFPAVVVYRTDKVKKVVTIDGNNRVAAHELRGDAYVFAYTVVNATPELVKVLTYTANVAHGVPTSEEERQFQAVELLQDGRNQEWVARALHLSVNAVKTAWALSKADRRAKQQDFSFRSWMLLPTTTRLRLGSVSTDEGFKALTKFVITVKANSVEVNDLVTKINEDRSAKGQVAFVERLCKEPKWTQRVLDKPAGARTRDGATTGAGATGSKPFRPRARSAYDKFLPTLNAAEKALDALDEIARGANLANDATLSDRCRQVATRLTELANLTAKRSRGRAAS
jgi:hypothetical protein